MIETLGLRYGYPGGAGLRFADVRIEQGGTLLLRGPSGSGKSTWLALAAGLLTATEGEMIVAGQPLRPLGGRARDAWRAGAIGLLPYLNPADFQLPFYVLSAQQRSAARILTTTRDFRGIGYEADKAGVRRP